MELKKRLGIKQIFVVACFLALFVYLMIGLRPAGAFGYKITNELSAPTIDLTTAVAKVELEDGKLPTPDTIAGEFSESSSRVLIFGHSSTVFSNLNKIQLNDYIIYNGVEYRVYQKDMVPKAKISMRGLLKTSDSKTIVVMTCAGADLGDGDATHRLLVYAVLD